MHALCAAEGEPAVVIFQAAGAFDLCSFALFLRVLTHLLEQWSCSPSQPVDEESEGKPN